MEEGKTRRKTQGQTLDISEPGWLGFGNMQLSYIITKQSGNLSNP